jgi:hypothetical protein
LSRLTAGRQGAPIETLLHAPPRKQSDHRATRKRELGANEQQSPAARRARRDVRTWTPDNLHGAEDQPGGARASVARLRCGSVQETLRQRALPLHRPSCGPIEGTYADKALTHRAGGSAAARRTGADWGERQMRARQLVPVAGSERRGACTRAAAAVRTRWGRPRAQERIGEWRRSTYGSLLILRPIHAVLTVYFTEDTRECKRRVQR